MAYFLQCSRFDSEVTDKYDKDRAKVVESSSFNGFVELVFWYNILQLDRMSVVTQMVDRETYQVWEKQFCIVINDTKVPIYFLRPSWLVLAQHGIPSSDNKGSLSKGGWSSPAGD